MKTTPTGHISGFGRRALTALLLVFAFGLSACDEPPEERLSQARKAATAKDLKAFTKFFTRSSKAVLQGIEATKKRTNLRYVKDVFKILPPGDVDEVFTKGNYSLVTVKEKKKKAQIRMLKEDGQWVIDAFFLEEFWDPIRKGDG